MIKNESNNQNIENELQLYKRKRGHRRLSIASKFSLPGLYQT